MNMQLEYIKSISKHIPIDDSSIYFYWKGRVALYALLKAIGIKEGDEVIMPGLTCVVVPNAVLYLKAKPVYVDVEINTCNPRFESFISLVSERTRVIIVQNTFGLSTDVDKIAQWAKTKGIYTIEDCTHGFGGTYKEKPNGSYCDAAIYSTQWNKPFSTGIGGFAIVNNDSLVNRIVNVNKELIIPTFMESFQLRLLIIFHKLLINNTSYWFFLALYRKLSKAGLVIGSSSRNEIEGVFIDKDYFKAASGVQFKEGVVCLKHFSDRIQQRKENAQLYSDFLRKNGKYYVGESIFNNHSFLKYPLLVKNRSQFMIKAEKAHIKIGDWFKSVLHPVVPPFDPWLLDLNKLPNASFLARHLVNLPTDLSNIRKVFTFLQNNIDDLIDDGKYN